MKQALWHLLNDGRYALRSLRAAPLFAAVAILSMAFGIGANTAVFTLIDQVLLRTLPVDRPHELVQVSAPNTESYGGGMGDGTELSFAMYRDLRDKNAVFSTMFCRMPWSMPLGFDGRTEQVSGHMVSGSFFPALGVKPAVGRLLTPDDDRVMGGHPVAVLGNSYWKSRFGGDPTIVGKTVSINRQPFEVIGIVESGFQGLDVGDPVQLYVPIAMEQKLGPPWLRLDDRRFRFVQVFARLREGITAGNAAAALQPLYRSILEQEVGDKAFAAASANTKQRFLDGRLTVDDASRGHSILRDAVKEPLLILMAVAGVVLLIVCANVANLFIARGAARQREMALRVAVGGSRWQIVRLLLVESVVLALTGAAFGLLLSAWGADALLAFYASPDNPLAVSSGPDLRILLFTSAIAVGTALLAGAFPAFRSTRFDLAPTLRGAGGAVVSDQARMRKTLVVAQVALAFLLLITAGLFARTLKNLLEVDPGFRTTRVVTFQFDLASSGYDADRARRFAKTFQERLSSTPGVTSVAYAFQSLLGRGGWGMPFTVEGFTPPPGEAAGSMANAVSPGYFKAMGIRVLTGREFDERDETGFKDGWSYSVAIVNETFARLYFGGANPVGRRVGIGSDPGTPTRIEIVGLVSDSRYTGIRQENPPQIYFPYLQATMEGVTAFVQTAQDPRTVMATIRREMAALDADIAIHDVSTLDDLVDRSLSNERLIATLSLMLSGMATLLSIVGLYGVVAYTVQRRAREIGIRIALGAQARRIAAGVLTEAGALVTLGLAVGFASSWWLGRYVQTQLYGVTPNDPTTILLAAAVLAAVAGAASFLPARRAARVTPMEVLRGD